MKQNQPKDGGKIPVITVKNGTQAFFFFFHEWGCGTLWSPHSSKRYGNIWKDASGTGQMS